MKLVIKKLDGRNTGHTYFKYSVQVYSDYLLFKNRAVDNYFFEMREWCWQTWGSSKELDEWLSDKPFTTTNIIVPVEPKCQNVHWCWKNESNSKNRIYLRDDAELVMLKLRWE